MTSERDGGPSSVLEAMDKKKLIVTTKVGGNNRSYSS